MSDYNKDDIKNTEDEPKYEDICYMCRRPESKTGRMLHIPNMNNMCICIDCMERSFRVMDGSNYADLMQGMNIQDLFPGAAKFSFYCYILVLHPTRLPSYAAL